MGGERRECVWMLGNAQVATKMDIWMARGSKFGVAGSVEGGVSASMGDEEGFARGEGRKRHGRGAMVSREAGAAASIITEAVYHVALLAQLVERATLNRVVVGSSPT
jgi:hypothetical protein